MEAPGPLQGNRQRQPEQRTRSGDRYPHPTPAEGDGKKVGGAGKGRGEVQRWGLADLTETRKQQGALPESPPWRRMGAIPLSAKTRPGIRGPRPLPASEWSTEHWHPRRPGAPSGCAGPGRERVTCATAARGRLTGAKPCPDQGLPPPSWPPEQPGRKHEIPRGSYTVTREVDRPNHAGADS